MIHYCICCLCCVSLSQRSSVALCSLWPFILYWHSFSYLTFDHYREITVILFSVDTNMMQCLCSLIFHCILCHCYSFVLCWCLIVDSILCQIPLWLLFIILLMMKFCCDTIHCYVSAFHCLVCLLHSGNFLDVHAGIVPLMVQLQLFSTIWLCYLEVCDAVTIRHATCWCSRAACDDVFGTVYLSAISDALLPHSHLIPFSILCCHSLDILWWWPFSHTVRLICVS